METATSNTKCFPENIPNELKRRDQWVAWNLEYDPKTGANTKKVPYQPNGAMASSTDPATWSTHDEVVSAWENGVHNFDGIGYVFSADDPYTGIDLDGCRNPVTGEIDPLARVIITLFATYVEISPSGTGLKLIVRAKKPAGAKCRKQLGFTVDLAGRQKTPEVEVYECGRYFTLTGDVPGTEPLEIADGQATLDRYCAEWWPPPDGKPAQRKPASGSNGRAAAQSNGIPADDQRILDVAFNAKNGDKLRGLFYGSPDPSRLSEDDQALAISLAFWTDRDPERTERLMRLSARVRPKWDDRRNDTTWLREEIERAINDCSDFYDWGQAGRATIAAAVVDHVRLEPVKTKVTDAKITVQVRVIVHGTAVDVISVTTSESNKKAAVAKILELGKWNSTEHPEAKIREELGRILAEAATAPTATSKTRSDDGLSIRRVLDDHVRAQLAPKCVTTGGRIITESRGELDRLTFYAMFVGERELELIRGCCDYPGKEDPDAERAAAIGALKRELQIVWAGLLQNLTFDADAVRHVDDVRYAIISAFNQSVHLGHVDDASGQRKTHIDSMASYIRYRLANGDLPENTWDRVHQRFNVWVYLPCDNRGELLTKELQVAIRFDFLAAAKINYGAKSHTAFVRHGRNCDPPVFLPADDKRIGSSRVRLAILSDDVRDEVLAHGEIYDAPEGEGVVDEM